MPDGRSRHGGLSTTRRVRTAVWDTARRKSLRRRRQQASTQLSERQGTQTPSLAPRAPPSRLKPERETKKFVVFLRERKLGAGQIIVAGAVVVDAGFLIELPCGVRKWVDEHAARRS